VSGSTQRSTEIAPSAFVGCGCDNAGYAYVDPTHGGGTPTAVVHRCTGPAAGRAVDPS
jgi:hypothetical protein